ncbi:MAG: response regulator transcription factor [Candidatus Obscuribacterales bacterium]|nr:response regulator transcription factor [Candidatus Obscuribacterales bacterium]
MAKILIAEDDSALRLSVLSLLKGQKHQVDAAETGDYALELLLNYHYDAVILDWDLPVLSGVDICRKYREGKGTAPVLFLTGKSDHASRVEGLDSGADDYLCKPFNKDELLARVRAMLRRAPQAHHSVLKVGEIAYQAESKTVLFKGEPVDVTKKELGIIEFFLRHPNQVFSTEVIVARVWSSESEVTPDTVRPYIKRLRDKLTDESGNCQLVTVHGSGYKLLES